MIKVVANKMLKGVEKCMLHLDVFVPFACSNISASSLVTVPNHPLPGNQKYSGNASSDFCLALPLSHSIFANAMCI